MTPRFLDWRTNFFDSSWFGATELLTSTPTLLILQRKKTWNSWLKT
jgi:hypothetical protein